MKIGNRLLVLGATAALAVGLSACGADSPEPGPEATTSTSAETTTSVAMPKTATYMAEMADTDGDGKIHLAINVEGEDVVAYECNGEDESAWFFGTQQDGKMELTSPYQDTLTAELDGTNLTGTLTINEPDAKPLYFTAAPQPEPAGMYTATDGDTRVSWVVGADGQGFGVERPNSRQDRRVLRQIIAQQQEVQDRVRQHRLDLQAKQAPQLDMNGRTTTINGKTVTAVEVRAGMKSLPNSN